MVTFRNNNARRNSFRRNDRNFKSNGDRSKFVNNFSKNENFQRKLPGRNNHNASKLIEKYNDLAREASSNGDNSKFGSSFSNNENFKRKAPGRNNHNASKLIEKYNDLAREALSNGDKILSENYLQHADHFTRVLNERESFKREKFTESRSENSKDILEENIENSQKKSDKESTGSSAEDNEIQKNENSQVEIN